MDELPLWTDDLNAIDEPLRKFYKDDGAGGHVLRTANAGEFSVISKSDADGVIGNIRRERDDAKKALKEFTAIGMKPNELKALKVRMDKIGGDDPEEYVKARSAEIRKEIEDEYRGEIAKVESRAHAYKSQRDDIALSELEKLAAERGMKGKLAKAYATMRRDAVMIEDVIGEDGMPNGFRTIVRDKHGKPRGYKDALQREPFGLQDLIAEDEKDESYAAFFPKQTPSSGFDRDQPRGGHRQSGGSRPVMTRAQLAAGQYPAGMGPSDAMSGKIELIEG